MTFTGGLDDIIQAAQVLIVPAVSAAAIYLRRLSVGIDGVKEELHTLNGRLIKLETWKSDHHDVDESRHNELSERIGGLSARIDRLTLRSAGVSRET